MTSPIQRPGTRPAATPPSTAEARPAEAAAAAAPTTTPASSPSGGASSAPTSYAEAKPDAPQSKSLDYSPPSTLTRTRPAEAPADTEASGKADKGHYPVKWEAEATLKSLKADPRVKGDVQMQLGRMIGSPGFDALGPKGQVAALELFKANLGDKDALKRVHTAVNSMDSIKSKQGRLDVLEGLRDGSPLTQDKLDKTTSLLHSTEFGKLKQSDQELITGGIKGAKADPKYTENLKKLIEDPKFKALKPDEKTAVLSQMKNYPDARSVDNVQKMLQKDWFTGFDLADKQRALKTVAFLSQHDTGDRAIIDNTLNKFLAPGATYKFDFTATSGYGSATGKTDFHFNPAYVPDGNDKLDISNDDIFHTATHTFAHEVNHLVNDVPLDKTYDYFMDEYRAFYVGFKAQYGRDPTRAEVLERAQHLITATSGAYDNIRQALADPVQGPKIVEFMKKVLGRNDVTQANAGTLAVRNSNDPAPAPDPALNMDNH
jgi:hypothetical protein